MHLANNSNRLSALQTATVDMKTETVILWAVTHLIVLSDRLSTKIINAKMSSVEAQLYILLFNPYNLPNFLTKFPTEPEVNLSRRRLRLLH